MNLKDKTDAELNEACARIMGTYRVFCAKPCPHDHTYLWPDECVNNKNGECPAIEPNPPDYVNSPDAQAELKDEVERKGFLWHTHNRWEPATPEETHGAEIHKPGGSTKVQSCFAATEGRALAEAFVMAFGEEK